MLAHARRAAFDAIKLNPDDRAATQLVARIDALFAIDGEARTHGLDQASRYLLRQECARPLLEVIGKELEAVRNTALPASALGKAANYTLSLWNKLTRVPEHPELELSNNLAENSMRPVVVGRKNWIHIGSPQAGPKVGHHSVSGRKLPTAEVAPAGVCFGVRFRVKTGRMGELRDFGDPPRNQRSRLDSAK